MYKMHFLSCIALTLALVADGAPVSGSRKETRQQVEQLLLDLQLLLRGVNNYENPKLPMILTMKFYMPKKLTELEHLQCLAEELELLEGALTLAESKDFHLTVIEELMSNINVTVLQLKGPETRFTCEYDDETATVVGFLNKWITFCQSIYSTLT